MRQEGPGGLGDSCCVQFHCSLMTPGMSSVSAEQLA